MNALQTIAAIGLVALGGMAVALVLRRVIKEGLSPRRGRRTATAIEVFAGCIPLKHSRTWALLWLIVYVILLFLLFVEPQ